jgi:hypothetical protein
MYHIAPALGHLQQKTQYDCWHASLRMMTKWKNGVNSEPSGTQTNWLYHKCRDAQAGFNATKQKALGKTAEPDDFARRQAGIAAKKLVGDWSKAQKLTSNREPFKPFTERPGLTLALLPAILSENKLRAVRGESIIQELEGTPAAIEQMLRDHGPLYCLVDFGHVIVISGIDGDSLQVCDPLQDKPAQRGIASVANSPCVARIVSFL